MTGDVDTVLDDLGCTDPDPQVRADLAARFYAGWDRAVGRRCLADLAPDLADELISLAARGDRAALRRWLDATLPRHRDIVAEEYECTRRMFTGLR